MISSEYTVPIQFTSDVNPLYSTNNYFESLEMNQNNDLGKSELIPGGLDKFLDPMVNKTYLENNSIDTYTLPDQNCNVNIAFHMSSMAQMNNMPSLLHGGTYDNDPINNNSIIENYNEKGYWNNYTNSSVSYQGYESDESSTSLTSNNTRYEGARQKILRNDFKFPYDQVTMHNSYGNQISNQHSQDRNITSFNQHRNINGLSKSRYNGNNNKRPHRNYNKYYNPRNLSTCVYGLMKRFKSRARLFHISPFFPTFGGTQILHLDLSIWDLYRTKAQTQQTYFHKINLWGKLYMHISRLYDRCGLFMVGSTMSGLCTDASDIDMCLLIRSSSSDFRTDAIRCLESVRNLLLNSDFVEASEVIYAKVPILKFKSTQYKFEVDLNCNNAVGIRNTHLLKCYAELDWRVRPLVIVIKLWAQANCINNAKNMTISSYSLALMTIHFLQCGVVPSVLPCLHKLYQDIFHPNREIRCINIHEKLPEFNSDNKQTLGELLLGFLQYYSCFPFETDAISVRLASRISVDECRYARSEKNDPHQWKYLCIEEPFDFSNTARSVYDLQTFKRIQRVFLNSSTLLKETNNLDSILRNVERSQR